MSVQLHNQINLANANDLANAISANAAKVVEANYNDAETIAIQTAIDAQVTLLRQRNAEIHQPLQREPGDVSKNNQPPVPISAQVDDASPTKLVIAFNQNVVDDTGTGYSIVGNAATVTAVEATGSVLTLTLSGPILNGETITTSYAPGVLANADYPTIAAAAYTAFPVVNNVQP